MRSVPAAVVAALAVAVLSGCDSTTPVADYSSLGLLGVTGTVTLDGQPLPDAVITFDDPTGSFSFARTDSAGRYDLQFDSDASGVTPGPKTVQISTTRTIVGLEPPGGGEAEDGLDDEIAEAAAISASKKKRRRRRSTPEPGDEAPSRPDGELVPARYRGVDSELRVTVSDDQTEFDFGLTSDE